MSPSGSLTSIALNSTGASAGLSSANKDNLASTPFGAVFSDAVGQIDALETQARTTVDGLITGGGVDVHQAVISTQKAEMAFELALSVRNKALQAYQSVMGMQF